MSIIARWYGNGLTAGPLDETSIGAGDTAWTAVTDDAFTIEMSGARPPQVRMDQPAAAAAQLIWDTTVLGSLTQYAVRVYATLSAYPSAGAPLLTGYGSGNTAQRWRIDVTSAGLVRLRDASNTVVGTADAAVPLDTRLRIDVVVDGTNAAVTVHAGEMTASPLVSLTGTVGSGMDAWRPGNPQAAPIWPSVLFDGLAVADTAAPIGPRVHRASAAWTADVSMAGTPRLARNQTAAWTVDVGMTGTPRVRRYVSAAWTIDVGMTIDTGTPPVSALVAGQWRPATVRHMAAGTWQPT